MDGETRVHLFCHEANVFEITPKIWFPFPILVQAGTHGQLGKTNPSAIHVVDEEVHQVIQGLTHLRAFFDLTDDNLGTHHVTR
jgi:hypothetical protein